MLVITESHRLKTIKNWLEDLPVLDHANGHCKGAVCLILADRKNRDFMAHEARQHEALKVVAPKFSDDTTREDLKALVSGLSATRRLGPAKDKDAPSRHLLRQAKSNVIKQIEPLFTEQFESDILNMSHCLSVPREYLDLSIMACAGSLMSGCYRALPRPTWAEPPIINAALIGGSGSGKSPALSAVVDPILTLETKKPSWLQSLDTTVNAKSKVSAVRFTVHDATIEAIADILAHTERGVLKIDDELVTHLGGMGRYSGKSSLERGIWLRAYNGSPITIDRRGNQGPLFVPYFGVSVIGGIQPSRLEQLFDESDDGQSARFLSVYPDKIPVEKYSESKASGWRIWPTIVENLIKWRLERDSENNLLAPIDLPLSAEAKSSFESWVYAERLKDQAQDNVSGFENKRYGFVLRLALIFTLIRYAQHNVRPVCIESSELTTAHKYFALLRSHRRRGQCAAGSDNNTQIAIQLARYLIENNIQTFNPYELQNSFEIPGLNSENTMREVLKLLRQARWIPNQVAGKFEQLDDTIVVRSEVFDMYGEQR